MKKKFKLLGLCAIMLVVVLTGCGKKSEKETEKEKIDGYRISMDNVNVYLETSKEKKKFYNYIGTYNNVLYFDGEGYINSAIVNGDKITVNKLVKLPSGLCTGDESGGCLNVSLDNFKIIGDTLYYSVSGSAHNENLYKVKLDGTKQDAELLEEKFYSWSFNEDGTKIYFKDYKFGLDNYNIAEYDVQTGNKTVIFNVPATTIFKYGNGKIYYSFKADDKYVIKAYDLVTKNSSDISSTFEVIDNHFDFDLDKESLYYVTGSNKLYKIDLNTNKTDEYYSFKNVNSMTVEILNDKVIIVNDYLIENGKEVKKVILK